MKKILILGGTGAMGKALVELIDKSENEIYITSRKKYTDININTDIVKPIKGNLVDELVEFLYIDSGEKYLMMHEKFLEIRKRLTEEGHKPIYYGQERD